MKPAEGGMSVSLHPNSFLLGADLAVGLLELVQRAEQAGVRTIALMDHFLPPGPQPVTDPVLEGYTALGFIAANTTTVDVMLLVSAVTHRHPALLAKAVTTLDVLSGGRARLGIGAGWYERENIMYGLPFPAPKVRFEIMDETLEIIGRMWAGDDGPFFGSHYTLESTRCSPMPVRQPRPPVLVGGNGRRRTLRLAARHADGCNLLAGPDMGGPSEVTALLQVLDEHCRDQGTHSDRIAASILYTSPVPTDPDGAARFAEEMRAYAHAGVEEVFVMPTRGLDAVRFVEELGSEVIPRVQQATQSL